VWFAAAALAAGTGTVSTAATAALAVRPAATAAVVSAAAVGLLLLVPMVALRLGRLPVPQLPTDLTTFRRDEGPTLGPAVRQATLRAGHALTALLGVTAMTLAAAAGVLVLNSGSRWAWYLAALAGLALLLRARAYAGIGQRAVLLAGGAVAVVVAGVRLGATGGPAGHLALALAAAVAGAGLVGAAYAVRVRAGQPSPYWSRLLDVLEFLAVTSLVPLAATVLGAYAAVRAWGG
jgi:type VII secretion integral membrane protein EccD